MTIHNTNILLPLSASYKYDNNFSLNEQVITSYDGYSFIYHPLFKNVKDITFNKESIFYLSSSYSLFDFVKEKSVSNPMVGTYLSLSLNNLYFTNSSNSLYLSTSSLNKNTFFKVIYNQSDNTFSFLNGNSHYITVESELPYNLYMSEKFASEDFQYQKFKIFSPDKKNINVSTYFKDPYDQTKYVERFWSYSPISLQCRAIGIISDDDYDVENKYLISVGEYIIGLNMTGLTKDQTWVRYYNILSNRLNNKNVSILNDKSYEHVKLNRLITVPYYSNINLVSGISNFTVDIANLKNVMTPTYNYHQRNE